MIDTFYDRFSGINPPLHGGTEHLSAVLDFSISVNPFELPQSVKNAYYESISSIVSYPDNRNSSLIKAVSAVFGIQEERLLITNGSAEAFSLIAGAILKPGKSAYLMSPCYSDYEHVSRLSGADVIIHQLDASSGFVPKSEAVLDEIHSLKPDLIWLCSPNNPTGVILEPELIADIVEASEDYGGFVVLDEAYSAFSLRENSLSNSISGCNLIRLRSLTKDFGVPGIRLGFVNAAPKLIRILDLYKPCWSVNSIAQSVGVALMNEIDYYRKCWSGIKAARLDLIEGLVGCGIEPMKASANECGIFIFFKTPEINGVDSFVTAMTGRGIIIRDCESMGAPGFCRIGVKRPEDNERFLLVLRKVLND